MLLFIHTLYSQDLKAELGYNNLKISPQGNKIIFSHQEISGFHILDLSNYKTQLIENNKFSAYGASFSPDGKYIAYKKFVLKDNLKFQQPVLYDIENEKTFALFEPVNRCGTPSVSIRGKIVFTIGKILHVLNAVDVQEKTINLPSYTNLTRISPNSEFVVFNDKKDRLWLLNIRTEEKRLLTETGQGYFEPLWSLDNTKIAASTMSGELIVFDIQRNSKILIGKGKHPVWTEDSNFLIYSKAEILLNREVINQDLYSFDLNSLTETRLSKSADWEDYPSISGNSIYFSLMNSEKIIQANLNYKNNALELINPLEINLNLNSKNATPVIKSYKKKVPLNAVYFDIW
jgi:Tol biopolymer transport system component